MAMAKHAVDRRVARTRATLRHALHPLILKKGYEAITIKDICDAANVGRSTFYAHSKSKGGLMRCSGAWRPRASCRRVAERSGQMWRGRSLRKQIRRSFPIDRNGRLGRAERFWRRNPASREDPRWPPGRPPEPPLSPPGRY